MSFEPEAASWLRWARTPGHDSYWVWRDAFFDAIVPLPGRCTLEVGCGEGRVPRDLASRGHRVVACDVAPSLEQEAAPLGGAQFILADGARLPLATGSVDLVVAYNVLMDVDGLPGTVSEAARVLEPGGRFAVCVVHPFTDAGRFDGEQPDAAFTVSGSYLESRTVRRGRVARRPRDADPGCRYPLQDYVDTMAAAGFVIERIREPRPRADQVLERHRRWMRLPAFLHLLAVGGS